MQRGPRIRLLSAVVALAFGLTACRASTAESTTSPQTTPTTLEAPTATAQASTTTTPLAPVAVLFDGTLLGWWSDNGWQSDPDFAVLDDGDEYRIFSLSEPEVQSVAGPPLVHCDTVVDAGTGYDVPLTPPALGLGVSAHAPIRAGAAEAVEPERVHVDAAHTVLEEREIDHEDPSFAQLIRADLDRDGNAEFLAVLERGAGSFPTLGDYGIVMIMFEGNPKPLVLAEHVVSELSADGGIDDWFYTATVFRFDAVADVNGDGVDEIALSSGGYEWWGTELYEWRDERDGFASVLANGCGV